MVFGFPVGVCFQFCYLIPVKSKGRISLGMIPGTLVCATKEHGVMLKRAQVFEYLLLSNTSNVTEI